jgi:hypothetical protein
MSRGYFHYALLCGVRTPETVNQVGCEFICQCGLEWEYWCDHLEVVILGLKFPILCKFVAENCQMYSIFLHNHLSFLTHQINLQANNILSIK